MFGFKSKKKKAKEEFAKQLKDHKRELEQLLNEMNLNNKRISFTS